MPVFNRFCYDPLAEKDSTRYVHLDPALSPETPLSCTITNNRPSVQDEGYCAISYVWGRQEFPYNLEIRDHDDTSYLRITASVDGLLRYIRSRNRRRILWIYALCINQESGMDKARQIPLMGKIYKEATDVFIWVGPEDNMTRSLFTFFRKVSRIRHLPQSEFAGRKQWDMAGRIGRLMRRCIRDHGSSGFVHLMSFFERPWFSRRWVIQEAYLATQAFVNCGRISIPLSVLISAARHLQVFDISWYSVKMTSNLGKSSVGLDLLELLWKFHESSCLEQKDRVVALVGLLDNDQRIDIDYTVHWTELYKQVATIALDQDTCDSKFQLLLHLFEFGPISRTGHDFYPSWIPDWSQVRKRRVPYYSRIRNPDTYEPYPRSSETFARNTLTFYNHDLQIHWHSSTGGPEGRRVLYATKFGDAQHNEHRGAKRTLEVLNQVFPSISSSILHILTLAVLVGIIVEYRHPDFNQALRSKSFNKYMREVNKHVDAPSDIETLSALGKLDALLEKLCLCELEPLSSESRVTRTFGFSTVPLRVGDTMIHLWQPEDPLLRKHCLAKPGQLRTMLAVRCHGEQQTPQTENRHPGQETLDRKGRVLGPAVCIKSDRAFESEADRHINTDDSCRNTAEQHSMFLY